MLEEYLVVIRTPFETEGLASHAGMHVQFDKVCFAPRPFAPPPLLVGGNRPNAIRRAALLGDGWHPLFMAADGYMLGRAEIEKIRAEEGITRPFTFSYSAPQTHILLPGERPFRTASSEERPADHESSYAPRSMANGSASSARPRSCARTARCSRPPASSNWCFGLSRRWILTPGSNDSWTR